VILVDTSVWVDHLRSSDAILVGRLNDGLVLTHPFVIGELALGSLKRRKAVLDALGDLPRATTATDEETLTFIDRHALQGMGIGYVDAHSPAAVALTPHCTLGTTDKRLQPAARRI
jgi:predicted nucleic acid-binding protein